ncbi:MAG: alpha/beta hydrolase [Acidobacteriia bacterium]|nr:alpha/beta hydrolase [Terriglobia bacterium]
MCCIAPLLAVALVVPFLHILVSAADTVGDCRIGAYRLTDGSVVDIGPSDADALRWRRFDGTTGKLHKATDGSWSSTLGFTDKRDGKTVTFSDCANGETSFNGINGHRIAFDVIETTFIGDGVKLVGRLVLPKSGGQTPILVLIHGSEDDSARDWYPLQRLLPAEGVGAFVYDKRGTGGSGGKYSQDFSLLANDAVAAMREARRLAGARAGRLGYFGTSQGGWVAPMAATRAPVDFVIVGFGLAFSVIDEDQQEVALEMRLKGHSPEEIATAQEVAAAAEAVFESGFTKGFERFDAVRAKYRNEPWYKDVHGNYTHFILPYNSEAELREKGKALNFAEMGTPFRYDPMPTLRAVKAPQLWILGEDDLEAPCAPTASRIKALGAQGRPVTLAIFPHAEHGIYEFETKADGERDDTRNADGYFAMLRDFARNGRLKGPYGASIVTSPKLPSHGYSSRPRPATGH